MAGVYGIPTFACAALVGGTYVGAREVQAFWAPVHGEFEYFNYDARAVLAVDDYIVIPVVARVHTRSGIAMKNEHLFLFRVKDGKVVGPHLHRFSTWA